MGESAMLDIVVASMGSLMCRRLSEPLGTHDGGIFESATGAKHYLKLYHDAGQAYAEAVANSIYNALGLRAPASALFDPGSGGVRGIANEYIEGCCLAGSKLTAKLADKLLDGVAADILLANWDAPGLINDNLILLPDGELARIDSGGTFAYRARGTLKPADMLERIDEWDIFTGKLPGISISTDSYVAATHAAGCLSLDAILPRIRDQVVKIGKFADMTEGFERLPPAFGWIDGATRDAMCRMLRSRFSLLCARTGII